MKTLLLVILILLPCNLGAQEGCGKWIKVSDGTFIFWVGDHYKHPDSVWVPKPCVSIEWDTIWDHHVVGDTLIIPPRQMTIEEKVDMLIDMVLSLTAEINYLKLKFNK